MTNNCMLQIIKEALEKTAPLFLGLFIGRNKAKDNSNELVEKARKAIHHDTTKHNAD